MKVRVKIKKKSSSEYRKNPEIEKNTG